MKKQTAVDWLFDKIKSHIKDERELFHIGALYELAKKKEKEQMITAWMDGGGYNDQDSQDEAEYYYNQTYGGDQ